MFKRIDSPFYNKAWEALEAAHKACMDHPNREPVLGMSNGPFSGVNKALGIISELEDENKYLRKMVVDLRNPASGSLLEAKHE